MKNFCSSASSADQKVTISLSVTSTFLIVFFSFHIIVFFLLFFLLFQCPIVLRWTSKVLFPALLQKHIFSLYTVQRILKTTFLNLEKCTNKHGLIMVVSKLHSVTPVRYKRRFIDQANYYHNFHLSAS